ncbi:MAG: hypothetical protein KA140_04975 [Caldisericia bacterium]|nr:hypothetical protein [Caldisericia bacterium]
MKKLLLILCAFLLAAPVSFSKGESPGLVIKPVHYTNKSPFILEGKAEAGSEIEIHGQGIAFKVGDEGLFKVELKVDEGINLFAITATKDGASSTKGFMVEMDTTPPEVCLFINSKLTKEKMINIELLDASQFEILGFTESGCKIDADSKKCAVNQIEFKAAFELNQAPSALDHHLDVTDRYGNQTEIIVFSNNIHQQISKMKIGSDLINTDGKEMKMDTPLQLIGNTAMISLDIIPEAILKDSTITISGDSFIIISGKSCLKLIVDKNYYDFNGKKENFSGTPLKFLDGHFLVPLRLICSIYNINLQFDKKTNGITLIRKISKMEEI